MQSLGTGKQECSHSSSTWCVWGSLGFYRGFFLSLVQVAMEKEDTKAVPVPSRGGWSWFLTELCCGERAAVMGALCSGRHLPSQEPNFLLLFLFLLPVPSWAVWFCFYGLTFIKPLLQSSHQVVINPEITRLLNTNYFVFLKTRALKVLSQKKKIFVGSAEASPGCLTHISLFGELVMCFPLDACT